MATLNYNELSIELPNKTMAIVKKEDAMHKATTLEDAYRKQYDFAIAVLGRENFEQMFGSSDVNNIDLVELTYVCNKIDDAYMEKINQQNFERGLKAIDNKAIDKLIATGESVKNINAVANKK